MKSPIASIVKKVKKSNNFLKRIPKGSFKSQEEFLELRGIWKGRKVSVASIRKVTWK